MKEIRIRAAALGFSGIDIEVWDEGEPIDGYLADGKGGLPLSKEVLVVTGQYLQAHFNTKEDCHAEMPVLREGD